MTDEPPETDEPTSVTTAPSPASPHVSVEMAPGGRDGVALVTIDRPDALNALTFAIVDAIATALETLDADPACRAIVVTGAGDRAFAAGADIKELAVQTPTGLARDDPFDAVGSHPGDRAAARRGGARGSRSVAAASLRWPAT